MSTAGKVLVVLVLLTLPVWMILSSGVSQLNTNGNQRLHELSEQIEKLQTELRQTQDEVVATRDETSSIQENIDHNVAMLRANQSDLQRARSQIIETLARNEYQLEIVQDTIAQAKAALQHRIDEQRTDGEALEKTKSEVKDLMARSNELLTQLLELRKEFQTKYHANIQSLGTTR